MKRTATTILGFTLVLVSMSASAAPDNASLEVAQEVKLYIAREHKKRGSNPTVDLSKLLKICGPQLTWTKGCRFWRAKSGSDKFMFQVRPNGKIYGIPSLLLK
jgi:hypothetical protein